MEKKKKRLLKLIAKNLTVLAMLVLMFIFVINVRITQGDNMHPAIEDGDILVIYRLEEPARGEIVSFRQNGQIRTGRIIAEGGDTIEISEDELLYVNSNLATEEIFYLTALPNGKDPIKVTVPENSFYILNDYRSDTSDSRTYGAVSRSDIIGNVIFVMRKEPN